MKKNNKLPITYAWFLAGAVALLIAIFWMFHLKKIFKATESNPNIQSFESLKSDIIQNIKD